MSSHFPYRGRFAPSPTGPLHFGSLLAALASYLEARVHAGSWLVRMEDIDTTRNLAGAADQILATLEAFGFEWSGEVLFQTHRHEAYRAALERLKGSGMAYGCACSRKEIADGSGLPAIDGGQLYPGTCRAGMALGRNARAWRLRVNAEEIFFEDCIQGAIRQQLERDVGDFVLQRADGLFAYQLAVTVDDEFQQISHIVRGADLLASTPRQIWLQRCLGYPTPCYAHLPVAANAAGEKLSKQTRAPALDIRRSSELLVEALHFLGQSPPPDLRKAPQAEVWGWAFAHWSLPRISRQPAIRWV